SPNTLGSIASSHSTVTLAGQVITGGVVSSTVIVCTQSLALPQLSTAVHVRSMVYVSGHEPGMVVSEYVISVIGSVQLSVAVASPRDTGKVLSSHSTVTLAGQVITGGVVSSTVIVCTQSLALPQSSTAVHVRSIV